ncbi:3-hydroxyacyl-CoA dehydrogenase [Microvirga sp. VF16]|uniref:3-hydroxyacyl-CoA dehydrogenase n=1 Tax=Microvirga sp. VF16 TaxID=2807101 RepID=UPI00193D0026|nr:3-hydroxyacyl-CoA dehydrogenase [Microvirga sp. VF16]QRM32167.1 3-hydroxyacyl-CoA dehydrogenase [Microvirga sp. VF16]
MPEKIAIVGCGLVGSGWAIVFARAGCEVMLFDAQDGAGARAKQDISRRLDDLARFQLVQDPSTTLARIHLGNSLADSLAEASYVQESVFERVDVKRALFAEMEPLIASGTIVGSSSSGIPASAYTDHVGFRERCLVAHPVNPPYLAPIVELVPAPWTAKETIIWTRSLMEKVGQTPVEMTREVEGFILNRLQGVLLREAWSLVEDGLATVDDVDKTISEGLGLRWSFIGPFETIDLNAPQGVADYAERLGSLYQRIAASRSHDQPWSPNLIAQVEQQRRSVLPASDLSERMAWRDRRLMALARHKRDIEQQERGDRT